MLRSSNKAGWNFKQVATLLFPITLVHVAVTLLAYRPLSAFWTASFFDAFDFSGLSYQIFAARGFFAESHRLWGYDPFFLAGNVLTFVWNSNVFLQAMSIVLWWLMPGAVLKVSLVLSLATMPWLFYLGWRGFGFSREHALIGAVAGVFWFRLSMALTMFTIGMITGVLVFFLSFAGLGLIAATLRGEKRGWWLFLFAPLTLLVHKTAAVTFAGPAAILLIWCWRQLDRKKILLIGGAAFSAILLNLFWIVPMLRHIGDSSFGDTPAYWINTDPLLFFRDLTDPSSAIGVLRRQGFLGDMIWKDLAVLGSLAALWQYFFDRQKRVFFLLPLFLGLFCYGGSFVTAFRPLDPNRYIPYFYLLLTVPAVSVLVDTVRRKYLTVMIVLGVGLALSSLPSSGRFFIEHPIETRPAAELNVMADWINALPVGGRIQVETFSSFESKIEPVPWNEQMARISILLPMKTKRPLLGGHYSGLFTRYNEANFFSGLWMGRPIDQYSGEELQSRLKLYGVAYLLTWSKRAEKAFTAHPELFERLEAPAPFSGWRVIAPGGLFLKGNGELADIRYDRLMFNNVAPTEGQAIVSFHWAPTLRCTGADMVPVVMPDDPVPMIGLNNPQARVVITNGSAR